MKTPLLFILRQWRRSVLFCRQAPHPDGSHPVCLLVDDIRRLRLLENAVVNYGGGLMNLQRRAAEMAPRLRDSSPDAAVLLGDIARYLQDVGECGHLLPTSRRTHEQ
ncbi:hypothetical protein R5P12_003530 [Klebsiella aerogenes]|uniref:hypothetical protein n=1 Tax=Klebsiella aerogenes TaxID=548 RepID=UPI000B21F41B|nr:hypothetical protein [Klebsiella aerogenes]ELS5748344.1 hypothetical protein [Klebsiella aerogenes]HEO1675220.1 hypothetical protein [Klebsiella aerogenes]